MEPYDEYVKFNCNNNLPTGIDPLFTSWKSPDTGRLHLDVRLHIITYTYQAAHACLQRYCCLMA